VGLVVVVKAIYRLLVGQRHPLGKVVLAALVAVQVYSQVVAVAVLLP